MPRQECGEHQAGRGREHRQRCPDPQKLLPTSLVGSYAQPDWLIDRKKLAGHCAPRADRVLIADRPTQRAAPSRR
jgi:hypothetical protein